MDVHTFHVKLLGLNNGRTPEEFWLNDTCKMLYTAYAENDLRGFSTSQLSDALFTATFVLALCLTERSHPVYLFAPKQHASWVVDQTERIGRHIFRVRKGDKEGVLVLRQAFQQIRVTHKILDMGSEPKRWTMLGFKSDDVLPDWAKNRLLEHRELQAPLTGARTTA